MLISNLSFSGPYDPDKGFQNTIAAVYAIVDDSLKVIDIGQTEDLNNRFPNHSRSQNWQNYKTGRLHLYIYRLNKQDERLSLEKKVRTDYNPPCGEF